MKIQFQIILRILQSREIVNTTELKNLQLLFKMPTVSPSIQVTQPADIDKIFNLDCFKFNQMKALFIEVFAKLDEFSQKDNKMHDLVRRIEILEGNQNKIGDKYALRENLETLSIYVDGLNTSSNKIHEKIDTMDISLNLKIDNLQTNLDGGFTTINEQLTLIQNSVDGLENYVIQLNESPDFQELTDNQFSFSSMLRCGGGSQIQKQPTKVLKAAPVSQESYKQLNEAAQRYQSSVENLNLLIIRTEDIVGKIPSIEERLATIEKREDKYVQKSRIEIMSKELTDLRSGYESWLEDKKKNIENEIKIQVKSQAILLIDQQLEKMAENSMKAMIKQEIKTEVTTRFQTIILEQINVLIKDKMNNHLDTQIAVQMSELNGRLEEMIKKEFNELINQQISEILKKEVKVTVENAMHTAIENYLQEKVLQDVKNQINKEIEANLVKMIKAQIHEFGVEEVKHHIDDYMNNEVKAQFDLHIEEKIKRLIMSEVIIKFQMMIQEQIDLKIDEHVTNQIQEVVSSKHDSMIEQRIQELISTHFESKLKHEVKSQFLTAIQNMVNEHIELQVSQRLNDSIEKSVNMKFQTLENDMSNRIQVQINEKTCHFDDEIAQKFKEFKLGVHNEFIEIIMVNCDQIRVEINSKLNDLIRIQVSSSIENDLIKRFQIMIDEQVQNRIDHQIVSAINGQIMQEVKKLIETEVSKHVEQDVKGMIKQEVDILVSEAGKNFVQQTINVEIKHQINTQVQDEINKIFSNNTIEKKLESVFENKFENKVKMEISDQINTSLETNMAKLEQDLSQKLQNKLNTHENEQVQNLDHRVLVIEKNIQESNISRAGLNESINQAIKAYGSDHDGEQVQKLREELILFKIEYEDSKNKMKQIIEAEIKIQIQARALIMIQEELEKQLDLQLNTIVRRQIDAQVITRFQVIILEQIDLLISTKINTHIEEKTKEQIQQMDRHIIQIIQDQFKNNLSTTINTQVRNEVNLAVENQIKQLIEEEIENQAAPKVIEMINYEIEFNVRGMIKDQTVMIVKDNVSSIIHEQMKTGAIDQFQDCIKQTIKDEVGTQVSLVVHEEISEKVKKLIKVEVEKIINSDNLAKIIEVLIVKIQEQKLNDLIIQLIQTEVINKFQQIIDEKFEAKIKQIIVQDVICKFQLMIQEQIEMQVDNKLILMISQTIDSQYHQNIETLINTLVSSHFDTKLSQMIKNLFIQQIQTMVQDQIDTQISQYMNQKIENQINDQSNSIKTNLLSILQVQVDQQSEALISKKCDKIQSVTENKIIKMLDESCLKIKIDNKIQINNQIKNQVALEIEYKVLAKFQTLIQAQISLQLGPQISVMLNQVFKNEILKKCEKDVNQAIISYMQEQGLSIIEKQIHQQIVHCTKERVQEEINLQVIGEVNNLVQVEIENVFASKFEQMIKQQVDETVNTIVQAQVINIEENMMSQSKTLINLEINEAVKLIKIQSLEQLQLQFNEMSSSVQQSLLQKSIVMINEEVNKYVAIQMESWIEKSNIFVLNQIKSSIQQVDEDVNSKISRGNEKIELRLKKYDENIELKFSQVSKIENRLISLEQTWIEKIDKKNTEMSKSIKVWVTEMIQNSGGSRIDEPQVIAIVAQYLKQQLDTLVKKQVIIEIQNQIVQIKPGNGGSSNISDIQIEAIVTQRMKELLDTDILVLINTQIDNNNERNVKVYVQEQHKQIVYDEVQILAKIGMIETTLNQKIISNHDELKAQILEISMHKKNPEIMYEAISPMDQYTKDSNFAEFWEFKKYQEILWAQNNGDHEWFTQQINMLKSSSNSQTKMSLTVPYTHGMGQTNFMKERVGRRSLTSNDMKLLSEIPESTPYFAEYGKSAMDFQNPHFQTDLRPYISKEVINVLKNKQSQDYEMRPGTSPIEATGPIGAFKNKNITMAKPYCPKYPNDDYFWGKNDQSNKQDEFPRNTAARDRAKSLAKLQEISRFANH